MPRVPSHSQSAFFAKQAVFVKHAFLILIDPMKQSFLNQECECVTTGPPLFFGQVENQYLSVVSSLPTPAYLGTEYRRDKNPFQPVRFRRNGARSTASTTV